MTRVLIGDALVNENERLQARINALLDKVEAAIKQALRIAATQENLEAGRRFRRPGQPAALLRRRPLGTIRQAAASARAAGPVAAAMADALLRLPVAIRRTGRLKQLLVASS
jgi:TetR/AcrR family transcriptional regulator